MADKKITDLTNKATAASADIVPIVDPTDNTTKRTTVAGLRAALMIKTTDANGWTIYDNGGWKEYVKLFGPYTITANAGLLNERYSMATAQLLPVGITSSAQVNYFISTYSGSEASRQTFSIENFSTTTFEIYCSFAKPSTGSSTYTNVVCAIKMMTK